MKPLLHDDPTPGGPRLAAPRADERRYLLQLLAGTMQPLIEDLREQIALLDERFDIVAINRAWRETVTEQNYPAMPGDNYRLFCAETSATGYDPAAQAVVALDDIAAGRRSLWQLVYNGGHRWGGRDFEVCFRRIRLGGEQLILVTRFDITELTSLRRARDDLTDAVSAGQAVARQRLGRELHDGTSQILAGIGLLMGRLRHEASRETTINLIEELQGLLAEAQQEIRAISYLANPPAFEKSGLPKAMKLLVEGFALRAGLEASFEISGDYSPLPLAQKTAIYRVAQEALTNVHRHARAQRVRLMLICRRSATHFIVADDGVGISADAVAGTGAVGVGLASMRARLLEIGGRASIRRLSPGTAIVASVPNVPRTRSASTHSEITAATPLAAHR